ncbi:MAG TPA: UbiD family decarboxylase [Candidatus Dormibacteraeota bacterium]|nr:UbiD family decarboxylase [Candidatus Dormibacteraeota bacterium]
MATSTAPTARAGGEVYSPGVRAYLDQLETAYPSWIAHVHEPVDPASFGVTAVLQKLEDRNRYPLVVFDRPLDLNGKASSFPLATNVFATRERCALALGLGPEHAYQALALEYARREERRVTPLLVPASLSPVKEVVKVGDEVDLREFPIVRHHRMDGGPYIDMASVMRDPDSGAYNIAFLRNQYKGPRKLGIHMSPRHNWQIARKHEEAGLATPVAIVASHHPAFYIGALNVSPFGEDDYEVVGSVAGAPWRLTPSQTWGEDFLVPADADIVIEGEIPPGVREVEGPFGEFPGTYGPQRVRWVVNVRAVTHRHDAIYQDIFVGHRDNWVLGSFPKEGSIFNRIKGVVPTVKAVHLPTSGVGRFHCYISIDKKVDGESKQAALIALGAVDFVKHVVVVDADIDVYREEEVLWAVATRVQADQDVDILKNVKGNTLDPSQTDDIMTAKMIIDATRPVRRPFETRIEVPPDSVEAVDLRVLLGTEQLSRLGLEDDL